MPDSAGSLATHLAASGRPTEALQALRSTTMTAADRLNLRLLEADQSQDHSDNSHRKIAILSLLFNWPSTGGGIVHTAELAQFLTKAGFDVCHFYAVHKPWEMGVVSEPLPYNAKALHFENGSWNRDSIISSFRDAIAQFGPDAVIVTDSWNTKPMLATAASDYPYFLRLAALECLCPLNNVRLIPGEGGRPIQCHRNQLANRDVCVSCVASNDHAAGPLHAAERQLSLFEDPAYGHELQAAFSNAAGILAVNPLIGTLCEPYSQRVDVIPSGFDETRFQNLPDISFEEETFKFLFAGLVEEYMKGFHILFEACSELWKKRQDFELHVTADAGQYNAPFLRYRGWQDQESLPGLMADCHAVVVPTIAQEALGRTAVEGMGAGRPVIASRIGGLPFTVTEGLTGLLAEPADAKSLAQQSERLLDDRRLAATLGMQGRTRFLEKHTWRSVIEQQYVPLFESIGVRR